MDLDITDLRILEQLQGNAVISTTDLAKRVNLSPTPCARRVKILEEAGLIQKRVTLLDPAAVGLPMTVFLQVTLSRQKKKYLQVFEEEVSEWPEIMECYLITGDYDFLLRVVVSDLEAYQGFLERLTDLKGISQIKSGFSLKQVRYTTELPLKHLSKEALAI